MRVAIVGGCGALGSALAAAIARAGNDIVIVDRSPSPCQSKLLKVEGLWEGEVTVCGQRQVKQPVDIVIFATKAYDLAAAIESVRELSARLYVSVQNGLGSLEAVEEAFGVSRTAAALSYFGVSRISRCHSRLAGGRKVVLGCHGGCDRETLGELAGALSAGGLEVETVDANTFEGERWLKIAVNCGINPVTALKWARNSVILEREEAKEMAAMLTAEAGSVARALGVELPEDPVDVMLRTVRETGNNCSSTVQDLSAGRETELKYINYAVWERSQGLEVKARLNLFAYYAVEAISQWLRGKRSPCAI